MNLDNGFTLVPPLVAIAVALWRKNAILALVIGVVLTWVMHNDLNLIGGVSDSVSGIISVLSGEGNQRILIFSLLIGAIVVLTKESGGVNAFISLLNRKGLVTNKRQASLLPAFIGSAIFTDTNLSMFTAGVSSQRLFDKYQMSRARLAFIIDSTCSPISILLLINGWGAYLLGLLDGYQLPDTVGVLIDTVLFNFYPMIILLMVYYTAISTKVYGPMRNSVVNSYQQTAVESTQPKSKSRYLIVPMSVICILSIGLLLYSGQGDIRQGSGSWSVMWAIICAYFLLCGMLLKDKVFNLANLAKHTKKGMHKLVPVVVILVLSFAFGDAVKAYGTGSYVSSLIGQSVPLFLIAPMIFFTAGAMAFATGTSWGTFAVLIPIAIPLANATGLPASFLVAAVLGGGVFGDHSSPISDSTIIASLASGCDHIEHVKTQLPYNFVAALLTIILYIVYVAAYF